NRQGEVTQRIEVEWMIDTTPSRVRCRTYRTTMEEKRVSQLLRYAQAISFFDLQDRFKVRITDVPALVIAVRDGPRFKRVSIEAPRMLFYYGARMFRADSEAFRSSLTLPDVRRLWGAVRRFLPVQVEV